MNAVTRLYRRTDEWAKGLSRVRHAALLGTSAGVGVLTVGLLLSGDLPLVQALTMGLVMFSLECAFGAFQTTEE
ncbi:hypothetical protein [Natronosalvus halobius]|uniref:hypothetical protein n=1 Tax=Natronosalvus halobius TaxID=2953746 RepID=UPI00209ED71F|nr:hypothetical protein [Natronosalvus halobius]USZ73307.1 hypothetical protein NGM15_08420 [Natronosalvus halobius]